MRLPSFDITVPDLSWFSVPRYSNSSYGKYVDAYTTTRSGTPMTEDFAFDYPLFSSIGMDEFPEDALVDRSFRQLSKGQARGLLLAILSRDEYSERIETEAHLESVRLMAGAPTQSIRLTDLRLAFSLSGRVVREKKKSLEALLGTLGQPITHAEIVSWKLELLTVKQREIRDRVSHLIQDDLQSQEDKRSLKSIESELIEHSYWVSFVAASLLLMLDLQVLREQRSVAYLARRIKKLLNLVSMSETYLANRVEEVGSVFSTKSIGAPPVTIYKKYGLLLWYRSGRSVRDILTELGINPTQKSSKKGARESGTRQWRSRLFSITSMKEAP